MMIFSALFFNRITLVNSLSIFFFLLITLVPTRNSFALPTGILDEVDELVVNAKPITNLGKGVELDGIDDWIKIPDITLANDFTIEGWVKLALGIGTEDALFGQEGSGIDINFYQGKARLYANGDKVAAKTALLPATWGHIAITRLGNKLTLYVNGLPDATGTWDGTLKLQAIGRGNRGFFKGMLDEVRIWNIARTKTEIKTSYNSTVSPNAPDLVAYWTFNNASQTVTDTSSSANHGFLGKNAEAGADDPVYLDSPAPFAKNRTNPFVVMQSFSFESNQPSNKKLMTQFGIKHLPEFGHGFTKNWDVTNGANPFYDAPNEKLVKTWASNTKSTIGFLNIEHLPIDFNDTWDDDLDAKTPLVKITDTDRERAIKEMSLIADWAHEANAGLKIGYFGVLPQKEYWAFVQPSKMHDKLSKLQKRNKKFKALAKHVDIIFPSKYTFYHKPKEWKVYVKSMFQEARQYNKPIYAFIWPNYHPSNPTIGGQFIEAGFWRMQLETLYQLGFDGVVILGGNKKHWNDSTSNTNKKNWWFQTLEFMRNKDLLPKH